MEEADASESTSALGRYDWRIGLLDNQVDFKRIQYFLFEKRLSQRAKGGRIRRTQGQAEAVRGHHLGDRAVLRLNARRSGRSRRRALAAGGRPCG